ncbi:Wall-associated receptor kinase 2 [Morus notabilis]|uniref:Wall-associated receptor kinase 2 n=1 Tax=Morus notabilis TaxID=981085 RepID=W9SPG4_9ROSA|nr:Wall-associated receptor kinase 2 [Morus notabilis]
MSKNCSLNDNFFINCSKSTPIYGENIGVTNISTDPHEMTIMWYVAKDCYNESDARVWRNKPWLKFRSLSISSSKNKFVVIGCDSYAYLQDKEEGMQKESNVSMGCMSFCNDKDDVPDDGSCSGIGCCQVDIPKGLKNATILPYSFENHTDVIKFNPCTYAFVVERTQFNFSRNFLGNFSETKMPVVVDWAIDNKTETREASSGKYTKCGRDNTILEFTPDGLQYNCKCKKGYRGNAYLPAGCTDIDECNSGDNNCTKDQICDNTPGSFTCKDRHRQSYSLIYKIVIAAAIGVIALFICVPWLYLVLKKRKLIQLKEKFFRQNGGLILRQKLSGDRDQYNSNETAKIFTEEELLNATLKYDDTRIIGQGGFGTVYKGILPDNRIVAIKKSKLMDQNQIEQFINEVVVLSQINHRNVVKLLGCCLETQVPSLVYEFVPNGTLSDHIHDKEKSCKLVWEIRLRIASETAEVLSYLHSAASTPIIHRDVKPSNILVDNYTAKVSDFGASRLVPQDQIELATMVQVVLVELLTGKKAICFERPEAERSLAMHFLSSMKRNELFEIVESGIVKEDFGNKEQVEEVARLARRCLNVNGEERPTMKEVAMELEGLRRMEKHPWANHEYLVKFEETESLLAHDQTSISYKDMGEISSANIASYDTVRDNFFIDFNGR